MYKLEYTIDGIQHNEYIQWEMLNEKRKELFDKQTKAREGIILFCNCNEKSIPMLLTAHDTPHIQTKNSSDKNLHFKFCKHLIKNSSSVVYQPAIVINDDGEEIASVCFTKSEAEVQDEIDDNEYKTEFSFFYNNRNNVIRRKMSFSAFVKYKNAQYFKINQHTQKKHSLDDFNNLLYGYINNAKIGKDKTIKDRPGTFVYMNVKSIEFNSNDKFIVKGNRNVYLKSDEFKIAKDQFMKTYNGLDFSKCLSDDECNIIFYGFKNTNRYPVCTNTGFLLVNKYGLVCESFNEVKMYNYLYDYIIDNKLDGEYIFYKPLIPENDYSNPNYISDGVLQKRNGKFKIIIEVFGRTEEAYIRRKNEKINSCKGNLIYWDVNDKESFNCFEDKIRELLT